MKKKYNLEHQHQLEQDNYKIFLNEEGNLGNSLLKIELIGFILSHLLQ